METTQKYCKDCERNVVAERKSTNHLLHLVLTLLTGGIWMLIWLGASIKFGGWRCRRCGAKV